MDETQAVLNTLEHYADAYCVKDIEALIIVAVSAFDCVPDADRTTANILVYSPGGYHFTDYVKVGLALMLLYLKVSLVLVPVIWPL